MAGKPDVGVWIEFRDIAVEFRCCLIVSVFSSQGLDEACRVAGEGRGGTIADLFPQIVATLGAATAEEQIVIDLVLGSGAGAIENSGGGPLNSNDDGLVALVSEDVTTETVLFPPKTVGMVEACADVFPFPRIWIFGVCICGHEGKTDDCFFVGDIRAWNLIDSPG